MADGDRKPEKINLEEILGGGSPAEAESIELLDPATGRPERPEGSGKPGAAAGEGELQRALEEKTRYYDQYVRTRADFENYQKRIERERGEERAQAGASIVRSLLPVLDNLDRALAAQPPGDPFREGIDLIRRQLGESLERDGLSAIQAAGGPFDPAYHEAVMTEATDRMPPGHVTEEIQRGYTFHGRVLRPTLVKVSIAAAAAPASTAGPDSGN